MHRWIDTDASRNDTWHVMFCRVGELEWCWKWPRDSSSSPCLCSVYPPLQFPQNANVNLKLVLSIFIIFFYPKNVQGAVIYLYISCNYNPTSFSKLTFPFTIIVKNVLVDTELTRVGSSWSLLGLLFRVLYWFCTECSMFSCQLKDTRLKYVTDIPFKIFFPSSPWMILRGLAF